MNKIEITKVFLDLDGLFADWDGKATEIFGGKHPKTDLNISDSEMWPVLEAYTKDGGMFASLEWMPDSKKLWDMMKIYNPTILTGIPRGKWAVVQKHTWVKREMNWDNIICCPTRDKQLHSQKGHLLIDDRRKNIEQWMAKGGHGIHHTSVDDTIEQLEQYDFSKVNA